MTWTAKGRNEIRGLALVKTAHVQTDACVDFRWKKLQRKSRNERRGETESDREVGQSLKLKDQFHFFSLLVTRGKFEVT